MAVGTLKSRWVETEIERNGSVYLLPLRCKLEARGNRLRTVVQTYCLDHHKWVSSQSGSWFKSPGADRLRQKHLDEAACEVADKLCARLETGPLHPDWVIPHE
jgi:hypothetical protein